MIIKFKHRKILSLAIALLMFGVLISSVIEINRSVNLPMRTAAPLVGLRSLGIYWHDTDEEKALFTFSLRPLKVEERINSETSHCTHNKDLMKWHMVFVVKSSIQNFDRRETIRSTWGSVHIFDNAVFEVVFVLGQSEDFETMQKAKEENELFGDVLQFNKNDTSKFLLEKVLAGMQWHSYLPRKWLYASIDDDVAINFVNLVNYFETLIRNYTLVDDSVRFADIPIVCVYNYQERDPPNRNPSTKWYVSYREYPSKFWPIYCRGAMYVTSQSMISDLFKVSRRTQRLNLDDVWITGFLRLKLRRGNANIMATQYSKLADDQLLEDIDFKKLIVKHFWGNIKEKYTDVPRSLRQTWKQEEQFISKRIKCKHRLLAG